MLKYSFEATPLLLEIKNSLVVFEVPKPFKVAELYKLDVKAPVVINTGAELISCSIGSSIKIVRRTCIDRCYLCHAKISYLVLVKEGHRKVLQFATSSDIITVDHVIPKKLFKTNVQNVNLYNLLPCCETCNMIKADKPILDLANK